MNKHMDPAQFTYKLNDLYIAPLSICNLMGYDGEVPTEITDIVNEELQGFSDSKGIEGGYLIWPVKSKANYILEVDQNPFKVGKAVWQFLRGSEKVAVFVCTAGQIISNRAKQLMDKGLLLEGYCVDVIGSVIVEAAMDKIQAELKKQMARSAMNITNRYSPGYCDWSVAEQHQLFAHMPKDFCHVNLNDSALMYPIKSISGFIGIGSKVTYNDYTCTICTQINCMYSMRKQKQ